MSALSLSIFRQRLKLRAFVSAFISGPSHLTVDIDTLNTDVDVTIVYYSGNFEIYVVTSDDKGDDEI